MSLINDIQVELGRPADSTVDVDRLELWIADAVRQIDKRATKLGRVVDSDDRDYVIRMVVVVQARRPGDELQVDVSIDDGQVSKRYQSSNGRVTIPDDLWDYLGLAEVIADGFTGSVGYQGCWR